MIKIKPQALHLFFLTGFFYLDKHLTECFLTFLFMTVISFKLKRKEEKCPHLISPIQHNTM